jgi:hypothetical protein
MQIRRDDEPLREDERACDEPVRDDARATLRGLLLAEYVREGYRITDRALPALFTLRVR